MVKKMKVAIISYSESRNPGAQLQSYALQTTIRDRYPFVDKCVHIQHRTFDTKIIPPSKGAKGLLKKAFFLGTYIPRKRGVKRYLDFQNKFLQLTSLCTDEKKLEELNSEYDMFISGSDQIWSCTNGIRKPFFLTFVNDSKKKNSYGASMGSESIPEAYKKDFIDYVSDYNHICVREHSTRLFLEQIIKDKKIYESCDPVFLMNIDKWKKLFSEKPLIKEPYIFVYSTQMSPFFKSAIKKIQQDTNCLVVTSRPLSGIKCRTVYDMSPIEFLNYEYNADYIVSTSFHSIAFAVIFKKELYCIPHSTRSSRTVNLLEKLCINRVIRDLKDINYIPIDYEDAESRKSEMVSSSLSYLDMIINKKE